MRASELMSTPVVIVPPEANLKEVAECMVAHRVGGVAVVDHFGHLVGIISESDLVSKLEYEEKGRPLTLREVGGRLHISRERVRELERQALKRIREHRLA